MPHKAVYSQPFEQNICITRICILFRINLAQIYYEYFGCSFEHQQSYRNVPYHFGIGRHRWSKCSIPHKSIQLGIAAIAQNVLYSIVWYNTVNWNTPTVEVSSCPCIGRYSLGNISLLREQYSTLHIAGVTLQLANSIISNRHRISTDNSYFAFLMPRFH